jgi:hypothetical protein
MSDTETITQRRIPLKKLQQYQPLEGEYSSIKKLIWVYFILLLFEGALRKWFLPGLSQGLLIVRDPIALLIYYIAYSKEIFPSQNKYIIRLFQWVILAVGLSIIINHAHPATIAYGARTNLLHFPLIFIMGKVLNHKDVVNFGKAFLVLALPMTWVVAQQFQADRYDIMNVASGGIGHQMMTSGDKVRASGTFSFISGIVFYYCFAVAFIIHGFLNKNAFPKWMLYLGTGATFLAMVTAGSRSVIAESLQVVACFGFLAYYRPKEFGRIGATVFGISLIVLFLYSQIDLFKEGLGFLSLRFEEASNVEGNPIEAYFIRYREIISSPYYYNMWTGFFGNGLGTATRAGSALGGGYGGAELSWSRPVMENGFWVGILFLAWRVWITKDLLLICIKAVKNGHYLAIFIFGAAGPVLLFGLLGQPTNLGFAAFGGGLCLAAAKYQKLKPSD